MLLDIFNVLSNITAPSTTPEPPDFSQTNTYEVYSNDTNAFTRILLTTELDSLVFSVGACSDAYIILHEAPGKVGDEDNSYHIVLGTESNEKSEIRKKGENAETHSFDTPSLLKCLPASRTFYLTWRGDEIQLRQDTEQGSVLFTWEDSSMYQINAIALGSRHQDMARWTFLKSQGK